MFADGRKAVVKLLLDKGAELESQDEYDRTQRNEAMVKLPLDKVWS